MKNPEQLKKKLAFLGGGACTIPSYRALLNALSERYDITVYFEFFEEIKYPVQFSIRMISRRFSKYRKIRLVGFAWLVFSDLVFKKFHFIHAHSTFPCGYLGIIFGKIFSRKVVVSLDAAEASALPDIKFGDLLNRKRTEINFWVINNADQAIALTHFLANEVKTNLKIHRPMHIIPRGVDSKKFKFAKRTLGQPISFLNVSYLNPVKDQETLIRAFRVIANQVESVLTHIGEDFDNGKIQKLTKELGLETKVRFLGLIQNDDLSPYYEQADILLHTSRYESQAVVVNEAMASGVLVCGTHVGLMSDLAGRCCLTVPTCDAEGLANTVLALLENPVRMEELRENAYRWCCKHDLKWTVHEHENIYESLFKGTL